MESKSKCQLVEIFENRTTGGSGQCGVTRASCMNNENFNLAIVLESRNIWSGLLELNYDLAQNKHCHVIPEVLSKINDGWVVKNVFHEEIAALMYSMLDYGYLQLWESSYEWISDYRKVVKIPEIFYKLNKANAWNGLQLKGKISHLFIIYIVLAGATLVVFLFEKIYLTQHLI